MNEKKMTIYHEIHRLEFSKSQIERKVGVNRDTIRQYLAKNFTILTHKITSCISLNRGLNSIVYRFIKDLRLRGAPSALGGANLRNYWSFGDAIIREQSC